MNKSYDQMLRMIFFLLGSTGGFASMILTCGSILYNAAAPDFSGGWIPKDLDTWVFIAKFITGLMISAGQFTSLILYRMTGEWTKLVMYWIGTALSIFITITTFHTGLQHAAVDAKHNDGQYRSLLDDERRIKQQIDSLGNERESLVRQREKAFNDGYKTNSMRYESDISIKDRLITEKTDALNLVKIRIKSFSGSDVVTTRKTYDVVSADAIKIFELGDWAGRKLELLLLYFVLVGVAVKLDIESTQLVSIAVCGFSNKKKQSSKKSDESMGIVRMLIEKWLGLIPDKPHEQQCRNGEPIIMRDKMTVYEIKAALPLANCILDAVRFITTRILFVGGSGGGKTTTIMELIKRYGPKDAAYFFMDPKNDYYNIPPGINIQIIGQGEKAAPVRDKLVDIMNLSRTRSAMTDTEVAKQQDVIVGIDEGPRWKRLFKRDLDDDFGDYVIPMLDYGRRNKIHIWLISQSDRAGEIGLEGAYDKIKNFAYKIHQEYDESSDTRWCELHRKRMPPELFQPPKLDGRSTAATEVIFKAGKALMRKFSGVIGKIKSDHPLDHSIHKNGDEVKLSNRVLITQSSSDLESDRFANKSDQQKTRQFTLVIALSVITVME